MHRPRRPTDRRRPDAVRESDAPQPPRAVGWTPTRTPGRRLHDGAAVDSIALEAYVAAMSG